MFTKESCFELGWVVKAKGLEGSVVIQLDTDDASNYKNLESVLLEDKTSSQLIPFFIKQISLSGTMATCWLEEIDSREAAENLTGSKVFLPESQLPDLNKDQYYFHEIIGFQIIDENHGLIGVAESVVDLPSNTMLITYVKNKEVLIPLQEEIVHTVDKENKTIRVNIPNGLLEIYLDEN